jgi:ubiquitin carboxyl-terminal hydrolase 5/13
MDEVRKYLGRVKVPGPQDSIWKAECAYTFQNAYGSGGVLISLQNWVAYCQGSLDLSSEAKGGAKGGLFLRICKTKVEKEGGYGEGEQGVKDEAPTEFALGTENGFKTDEQKYEVEEKLSLFVYPQQLEIDLPNNDLPLVVSECIASILDHKDGHTESLISEWKEELKETKYAKALILLEPKQSISSNPDSWRCRACGAKTNLWLNLSDGYIGCGRQNFDGTGGCGAALTHYTEAGSVYPLAVKLGTITPKGADVFSYAADENDMVINPFLSKHLQHWGINMLEMEKTDKTMAEMQIDLNMKHEFDMITEEGSELVPASGPGLVGMTNLGNSCYMNSVMQLVCRTERMRTKYADQASSIFEKFAAAASTSTNNDAKPQNDLIVQVAKLSRALVFAQGVSEEKEKQKEEKENHPSKMDTTEDAEELNKDKVSISPNMFKTLIGRGHPEFASSRQQDSVEFFQYFLEQVSRKERADAGGLLDPSSKSLASEFNFLFEDRFECTESKKVMYKQREDNILALSIPLERATNLQEMKEYEERQQNKRQKSEGSTTQDTSGVVGSQHNNDNNEPKVIPKVPLDACLGDFAQDESLEDFYSSAVGRKGRASRRVRFKTFPPYLVVYLRRYYVDANWRPQKLDVSVDIPDELSLEMLKGSGLVAGEEELPEEKDGEGGQNDSAAVVPNPDIVTQLMGMGFSENGCKRAAIAMNNASAEACMEWIFQHMEDADFNDPIQATEQKAATSNGSNHSAESLGMLSAMGFTERQCKAALEACQGSVERAADWLFSHAEDLEKAVDEVENQKEASNSNSQPDSEKYEDGPGRYKLAGIVSHIGKNTGSGHYVAHIKRGEDWYIFNDEKVALSKKPPLDFAYMCLFERE